MKYKVSGTVEINWEKVVTADSLEEAEELAISYVEDGDCEFSGLVGKVDFSGLILED